MVEATSEFSVLPLPPGGFALRRRARNLAEGAAPLPSFPLFGLDGLGAPPSRGLRFRAQVICSEKVFVSQERVSGLPEKGADLRGSPETSGKFGELPGKFGELPGNLRIAVKFHSERTSGEVAENFRGSSGNFRGSPGTSQKLGGA